MRYFYDLDINRLIESPRAREEVTKLAFKRGDWRAIELIFVRGGTVVELDDVATGQFGCKAVDNYAGDFLVWAPTWTKTGEGVTTVYTFEPNFNTNPLNDALVIGTIVETVADIVARYALTGLVNGDIVKETDSSSYWKVADATKLDEDDGWELAPQRRFVSLIAEFEWVISSKIASTPVLTATVANDVIKGLEGIPAPANPGVYNTEQVDDLLDLKADKIIGGTNGNIVTRDAGGNIADSGKKFNDSGATTADIISGSEVNERIEAALDGLTYKEPVLSIDDASPGSPSTGDRYLVGDTPSGAWVGHEDAIAQWGGAAWQFEAAVNGDTLVVLDLGTDGVEYRFTTGGWAARPSLEDHNSLLNKQGGGTGEYYHLTEAERDSVPTPDQRAGLDGSATPVTASNPVLTEADDRSYRSKINLLLCGY